MKQNGEGEPLNPLDRSIHRCTYVYNCCSNQMIVFFCRQVYHCDDGSLTIQRLTYKVGDNSLLCVIPDYCVCYKDANFSQTQVYTMRCVTSLYGGEI